VLKSPNLLQDKIQLKILSYNILADCYTDKEHGHHLNQDYLNFKDRHEQIKRELIEADADILCL